MDLSEFVKESLVQIAKGVREAGVEARPLGAVVNPATNPAMLRKRSQTEGANGLVVDIERINFDVAVFASDESKTGAGGGLTVASVFKVGGESATTQSNRSESRIQFSVPMALPASAPLSGKAEWTAGSR